MPGPTPTPTGVLRLSGSWRANAREKNGEPTPPLGKPRRPQSLTGQAKRKWDQLVPILHKINVLTTIDADVMEQYCRTFERWRKLHDFIDEHGEVYPVKNKAGEVVGFRVFPQAKLVLSAGEQLMRLGQQLGLSPAARARLRTEPKLDDGGEKSRFFKAAAR